MEKGGKYSRNILEFTREFKYSMKVSFYRRIKYLTVKWSGLVRFSILSTQVRYRL